MRAIAGKFGPQQRVEGLGVEGGPVGEPVDGLDAGAFVLLLLNAERNSQWRLSPCTKSSASTITLESWLTIFVFAWTWLFRLLVRLAKLSSERPRFSANAVTLVLALARVAVAFPSAPSNWKGPANG